MPMALQGGDSIIPVPCDIGDVKSLEEKLSAVGDIDLVVNNAGLAGLQPFLEADVATFQDVSDTLKKSMAHNVSLFFVPLSPLLPCIIIIIIIIRWSYVPFRAAMMMASGHGNQCSRCHDCRPGGC